jgi:protease-4
VKKLCLILLGLFLFVVVVSALIALLSEGDGISLREKVALVHVEGPIFEAKSAVDEIKEYLSDSSIKAIIVRVDSPGGGVAASQEIFASVKRAASEKSVVVSMGSVAASGGYYISAPATRILANPGTITGSIGVILEIPNVEGLMDKVGVRTEVIKSGKHKDLASAFRTMSDEDRRVLQNVIDDVYEQFIEDVAAARDLGVDEVRGMADGRIYTGRQALELGLIDELGGLEEAIKRSAELTGIEGEPQVVTKEEEFSLLDFLKGKVAARFPDVIPSMKLQYIMSP